VIATARPWPKSSLRLLLHQNLVVLLPHLDPPGSHDGDEIVVLD